MEAAIAQLGYESVVIAQPSWLVGDRTALGQPPRPPKSGRSEAKPGVGVLKSGAMQAGN